MGEINKKTKMKITLEAGQDEFKTPKVLNILGIKKERLRQWLKLKYITPSIEISSGPGKSNIFSKNDLYRIAVFMRLIDFGLNRWISSKLVHDLDYSQWNEIEQKTINFMLVSGKANRGGNWKDDLNIAFGQTPPPLRFIENEDVAIMINLRQIVDQLNIDIKTADEKA